MRVVRKMSSFVDDLMEKWLNPHLKRVKNNDFLYEKGGRKQEEDESSKEDEEIDFGKEEEKNDKDFVLKNKKYFFFLFYSFKLLKYNEYYFLKIESLQQKRD